MRKKAFIKVLVLFLVGFMGSFALGAVWTGTGTLLDPNDNHWDVDGNWNTGLVPAAGESVFIDQNTPLQPLIDSTVTAQCGIMRIGGTAGGGTTNTLTVTGGSLLVNNGSRDDDIILGQGNGSTATIDISGGTVTARSTWVGNNPGLAILKMTGGTLVHTGGAGQKLFVDRFNRTTAQIQLYGGLIDQTGGIYMGVGGSIDITEGDLIFSNNVVGTINNYINSGQITAYGSASTVLVDWNDPCYPDKTWVRAELYPKAWSPDPLDGGFIEDLEQDISWMPGYGAQSHDVYFGTTNPPPFIQNQTETTYDPGALALGQTYYWRIDENDGSTTHTGEVWSFTVLSAKQARNPMPASGATDVDWETLLSWTPGEGAVSHDVYLGESADALEAVSLGQADPNYDPGTLIKGRDYFWKVDEFDGTETTEGVVWSFTVVQGSSPTRWTNNDTNTELWTSEGNWDNGVPGINSDTWIDVDPNVLIDETVEAVGNLIRMSVTTDANVPGLRITGGSLTTYDHFIMGQNAGSHPVIQMDDGLVTFHSLWVGNNGSGTFIMNGGTLNIPDNNLFITRFGLDGKGPGTFILNGGVVNAHDIFMGAGILDIAGGTLIIDGNKAGEVQGYLDNGWITAYGSDSGPGVVIVDYNNVNPGKTTVIACPIGRETDFNGDCTVDTQDLGLMAGNWLFQTPSQIAWEFDMSTDPVGPGMYDLELRDTVNTNYNMTDMAGMLHVTGPLLLDEKIPSSGLWDADLHYIARSETEDALKLWVTIGSSASPGMQCYVGVSIYQVPATDSQTVEIWRGSPPHVTPYTPVQITGFDPDALIDISVSYDYDTDTFDWTASDGTTNKSGNNVSYSPFNNGNGGNFTIHGEGASTGFIDYMNLVFYGSDWYSTYDLQPDGSVNLGDFSVMSSEWLMK